MNFFLLILGPILFAIMFFLKTYRTPSKKLKQNNSESQPKLFDRERSPRLLIIILVSVFLAFYCVSESVYKHYSSTYFQYIPLKLTASKSAEIVSAMALTFTIGRGISVFIAFRIRPQLMIAYHFLILITSLIILFLAKNSLNLLWTGSLMTSLGFSPIYPAVFAFISQYLHMTNRVGTVFIFSSSSLNLFLPYILGTFIEKNPIVFMLTIVTNLLISILLSVIILYVIRKTGEKQIL